MREYIDRLIRCGLSAHEAHSVCYNMIKEFGEAELEVYINTIECSVYGGPVCGLNTTQTQLLEE